MYDEGARGSVWKWRRESELKSELNEFNQHLSRTLRHLPESADADFPTQVNVSHFCLRTEHKCESFREITEP